MADKRTWFKVDCGYYDNPKVVPLVEDNPRAVVLHGVCIAYARRHLTDGVVPLRVALRQACAEQSDMDALIEAGLIETSGDPKIVVVHDYLEHQQSAAEADLVAEKAKRAARVRWGYDDALSNAPSMQDALPNAMQREREEREERSMLTHAPAKPRRRRSQTSIPDDWKPNQRHAEQARERSADLSSEAFAFRNHAQAHDRRCADWDAAFRNWLAKAKPAQTSERTPWDRATRVGPGGEPA